MSPLEKQHLEVPAVTILFTSSSKTLLARALFGRAFTLAVLLAITFSAAAAGQSPVPAFTKSFAPDTIGPGSVSTLSFTVANGAATVVEDLAFTDNLPAGVTIATPANASASGCRSIDEPVLSAPDGGTTISFSDGSVGAGSTCVSATGSAGRWLQTIQPISPTASTSETTRGSGSMRFMRNIEHSARS